jgi:hypothetical protein
MSSSAARLLETPADGKTMLAFLFRPTLTVNGMTVLLSGEEPEASPDPLAIG